MVAAVVVSTGILAHVNDRPSRALTLAGGIVAFVAAVLAGLQSFYKFGEVAEKHRVAAADHGDARTRLELFLAEYADADQTQAATALGALTVLAATLSDLDRKAPAFPRICSIARSSVATTPAPATADGASGPGVEGRAGLGRGADGLLGRAARPEHRRLARPGARSACLGCGRRGVRDVESADGWRLRLGVPRELWGRFTAPAVTRPSASPSTSSRTPPGRGELD